MLSFLLFLCVNCCCSFVYSRHCEIRISKRNIKCDCSSRNLTFIPTDCPSNTTDLYVFNNNLNILGKASFTGYAQLQYLDISHCNVYSIEKLAFENLTNLKVLNLSNNPMNIFLSNVFLPLDKLRNLYLSQYLLST